MNRDFQDFLRGDGPAPSSGVRASLRKALEAEAPRPSRTATKLAGVHVSASIVTLSACPQFGLRLFFDGHGLMHYFMGLGDSACWFLCGFFYLSVTALFARVALAPADWGLLRTRRRLWMPALLGLTMGTLIMITGEFSVEYGLMWLLGSAAALWALSPGPLQLSRNSTIKG